MLGALYAYGSAILVFGMTAEVHTPFLKVAGTGYAIWLVVAGSIMGWNAARHSD